MQKTKHRTIGHGNVEVVHINDDTITDDQDELLSNAANIIATALRTEI